MGASVLLYEDEPQLRSYLENVFHTIRYEFALMGSFEDADNVMDHIAKYKPNVVIMDIQMKYDDDGIYALYKIKNSSPGTLVMMLTTFDQDEKIFNAISLGADGYMLKSDFSSYPFPQEAIRKSLNIVLEGGAYLTPSVAKRIITLFRRPTVGDMIEQVKAKFNAIFSEDNAGQKPSVQLTPMQLKVLHEIAEGKSTAEIARELNLSGNTINTHIKAIYAALGVNSRTKALRKAMEKRLLKFSVKV